MYVQTSQKQSLVNYKALKENPAELDRYIKELSEISKKEFDSWSGDQKLSTLINGYNAWTIRLILDHYPVTSIKKIGPFYSSPWKLKFIKWLGLEVSLDEIEHERIRKVFSEPRIHFALVCASISCPSLQKLPFLPSELNTQFDQAMDEFFTDHSKNNSKVSNETLNLFVSSIFKWYGSDFGTEKQLVKTILKRMGIEDQAKDKKIKIEYLNYDWSLNEAK